MKGNKILYVFDDPLGANDCKAGITGHAPVRWGVYQNSYSKNSHTACFNVAYFGPARAIENLEKAIKQSYDWSIERDGRGHSEWISGHTSEMLEIEIDKIISGYKFKVQKVDKQFLPLSLDNYEEFQEFYDLN